jgi:uncharacterized RDD family membrane protein YckC
VTGDPDPGTGEASAAEPPSATPNGNGALGDGQATRIAVAAARAQAAARSRLRGAQPDADAPLRYVGLVTRSIAFAIDAAIICAVALLVWVAAVLTMNVLNLPQGWDEAIYGMLGLAFVVWSAGFFVTFWATTGQTPGDRLLQFRVVQEPSHEPGMPPRRAIVRLVGLTLAVLPFGAGIFFILVNDRRRGLQDVLARTVVIEAPVLSDADRRRIAAMEAGVGP